jgi:hypothetical protein
MTAWRIGLQRVWFRLRDGVDRARAFEAAAGVLVRRKPRGTALGGLELIRPVMAVLRTPRL